MAARGLIANAQKGSLSEGALRDTLKVRERIERRGGRESSRRVSLVSLAWMEREISMSVSLSVLEL